MPKNYLKYGFAIVSGLGNVYRVKFQKIESPLFRRSKDRKGNWGPRGLG